MVWLVLLGGLVGAVLLLVAEFTPLFTVHSSAYAAPVRTERTGAHDSYALVPLGLLALGLTLGAVRARSHSALAAIGAIALVALGIALLGDLPDAQATGIVGGAQTSLAVANSTPSIGLYLETLGAIVLLLTAGAGLLMSSPRGATDRPATADPSPLGPEDRPQHP